MKVAVVGVTGVVGTVMLDLLDKRKFPISQIIPVASEKSVGKKIGFKGKDYSIVSLTDALSIVPVNLQIRLAELLNVSCPIDCI